MAEEKFTSSLSFSEPDRWQLVGASQNYGSNYSIYAKITCSKPGIVTGIDLEIVNYKGTIKLGIYDAKALSSKDKKDIYLYIRVQALLNKNIAEVPIEQPIPYDVTKGRVITERILMPMYILEEAPTRSERHEYFEREISAPFKNEKSKVCFLYSYAIDKKEFKIDNSLPRKVKEFIRNQNAKNTMIVDSEFFYKDGDKFIIPKYDYDEDPDNRASEIRTKLPGFRCKMGTFNII